jgi:hypothetical protein
VTRILEAAPHLEASAVRAVEAAVARLSSGTQLSVGQASRLLLALGSATSGPAAPIRDDSGSLSPRSSSISQSTAIVGTLLAALCATAAPSAASLLSRATATELADLLWALSELGGPMPWEQATTSPASSPSASAAAPAALQAAVLARVQGQDFLAPALCRAICALGGLAASISNGSADGGSSSSGGGSGAFAGLSVAAGPSSDGAAGQKASDAAGGFRLDPQLLKALNEEARYQLTEFDSDFSAADLALLIRCD